MTVVFVVNPRSAGGATGRAMERIGALARDVFGSEVRIRETERPMHATDIAAEEGRTADLIVSVGGDGTANEVVNGLARLDAAERPALGVLPAGTGCDLVRSVGMPSDLDAAVRLLRDGERRPTDWMEVEASSGGETVRRVCINVTGFGMAGEVVKRANESSKRFGGRVTFAVATARTALAWKSPLTSIDWDGPDGSGSWSGPLSSVFVANGHYCGGGMWVGKGGRMDDGVAEMTLLPEMPLSRSISGAPRLYTGTIGAVKGVVTARVTRVSATCGERPVLVDVDGEQPGSLPVQVRVERHALRLVGRWDG
ncbi:MAG: diacylglycerol kinase family protein [Myxococcota bacterium]